MVVGTFIYTRVWQLGIRKKLIKKVGSCLFHNLRSPKKRNTKEKKLKGIDNMSTGNQTGGEIYDSNLVA